MRIYHTRPQEDRNVFRDNGTGMSHGDLKQYLTSIGKSGTKLEKDHIEVLIGQFGSGFLSAFVVAGRVEVRTRKMGDEADLAPTFIKRVSEG